MGQGILEDFKKIWEKTKALRKFLKALYRNLEAHRFSCSASPTATSLATSTTCAAAGCDIGSRYSSLDGLATVPVGNLVNLDKGPRSDSVRRLLVLEILLDILRLTAVHDRHRRWCHVVLNDLLDTREWCLGAEVVGRESNPWN